ncbi:MAG: hypothetical protein NTX44_04905 [Ignavibacteriales bacterium]|nr:hypothetical protein [Ignavibacteriales bacterium]
MKKMLAVSMVLILLGLSTAVGQGKFSGYMFGDYYYNVSRDAGIPSSNIASPAGTTAFQAFQLRRMYFTYDNDISEQFTTRFRLEADQAANASNGKIGTFVKDAYIKWKNIFSGSDLVFGIQPPPAYEVSEAAWGYRSLEKTIMDLRGIVSSRDQGISLHGKITNDGMFNYWVMFANNSANSPETDKYKRYYAHIHIKPTVNFQGTLYVDYKDAADILNSYTKSTVSNSAVTTALFLGYSEPFSYNIGVEAFLQSASNSLKDTVAKSYSTKSTMGFSVFGSYNILPELAIVVRYDNFNPSTDDKGKDPVAVTASVANGNLSRNYIIAGLSWKVDKNVAIMPNVLYETYEAQVGHGTPDPSITARITLFYTFL